MKTPSQVTQFPTSHSVSASREARLFRYCAAGLGAAAVTSAVTNADAGIVFVNFNNQMVVDTTPGDTFYTTFGFDLDGNGTIDFRLGQRTGDTNGGGAILLCPTGGTLGVVGVSSSGYNYAARLSAGALIGPGTVNLTLSGTGFPSRASMASQNGFVNSQWASPSPATGFLGIKFTGVGGLTEFAWIQLSVAGNTNPGARVITLISAAYDNTGAAITAGATSAVPEPTTTSLGLLALGAFGLRAHRRRAAARRSAAAA